jgi:hypothetical protein
VLHILKGILDKLYLEAESKIMFVSFLQLAKDLLHPSAAEEKRKHKLKRLVQHPNSYFMDVKCPGELYHHAYL